MNDLQEKAKTKNEILSKFEKSLSGSKYKLEKNSFNQKYGILIDGLITTEQGYPYCVIYVNINLHGLSINFAKRRTAAFANTIQARFAVITDGEKYLLFDTSKGKTAFETLEYNEIIKSLKNEQTADSSIASNTDLYDSICNYFHGEFNFIISKKDICFDRNKCTITPDKENELIEKLFNFEEFPKIVCRYTSLSTLLEMIKDDKIKMYGLAGMNDKSEIDYIERVLSHSIALLNPRINKLFIMSCSEDKKEDDLTLWRLYGDDCRGVCLKFELKEKNDPFVFRKIKYLNKDSDLIGKLKDLVDFVYDLTGHTFVFETLHEWCHFIKSEDYKVESEVRMLYKLCDKENDDKISGWVLANGTNVITPYKEFTFDEFPLKLKEIILGPKFPASGTNLFQLRALLRNNSKLKNVRILTSKIRDYR